MICSVDQGMLRTHRACVSGSTDASGASVAMSLPLRSDPWGNRYLVNTGALQTSEPEDASTDLRALWVLSAGPNGLVETPYAAPAVSAVVGGDDIGARIE